MISVNFKCIDCNNVYHRNISYKKLWDLKEKLPKCPKCGSIFYTMPSMPLFGIQITRDKVYWVMG